MTDGTSWVGWLIEIEINACVYWTDGVQDRVGQYIRTREGIREGG